MSKFNGRQLKSAGLKRCQEMDFSDDGVKFFGYMFNDIVPVTYAKHFGMFFISIRYDYIDGLDYSIYKEMPGYFKSDDFNGVEDLDVNDLRHILEYCYVEIEELLAERR